MDIKVEDIVIDPKIVDRVDGLDFVTIQTYADDMESGSIFPAVEIVSDGQSSWLVDGQHRLEAVKKLEHETITANVTEGDYRDALLKSCATNSEHGKRRTNEDKRQKVMMLLEDKLFKEKNWSNREIARQCKVDEKFVRKMKNHTADIRSMETERTFIHHKTGKPTTMNTTNIGKSQPDPLAELDPVTPVELNTQTQIEPIITAETAYEDSLITERKQKALKQLEEDLNVVPLGVRYRDYLLTLLKASMMSTKLVEEFDPDEIQAFFLDNIPTYERTKEVLTKQFDFLKLVMGENLENEFD
jgi:hypothetical protein